MLHTIVYDTCFSPCGGYVVAGTKCGDIVIFNLNAALSSDVSDRAKLPIYSFKVNKGGAVYNLLGTDTLLICAGEGGISAYRWSDIISKNAKSQWSLAIPQKDVFSHPEVNSCVINNTDASYSFCKSENEKNGNRLYAGCGDNLVHEWDLETGQHLTSLSGHTDYLHAVAIREEGRGLVSASEDGTARIWDLRSNQTAHVIKPFENEMCARPAMGKWLQCLALNEDDYWLLLGGGPTLTTWHLKTLTPVSTFKTPGVAQHVAFFDQDKIYSAGSTNIMNHWSLTGDKLLAVPVNPSCVYSQHTSPANASKKVMVIAGCGSFIDVCTNYGYTAFSLSVTVNGS